MSTAPEASTVTADPREFVHTRLFDVPREKLYRAFADPAVLARWWGPTGFSNTFHQFDFRPGGMWHLTMHGPDGTNYANESEFLEVTPLERIVVLHIRPMHRFQLSLLYADEASQTRLTWRLLFETEAEADRVRPFIPSANEQNLDRLQAELAKM